MRFVARRLAAVRGGADGLVRCWCFVMHCVCSPVTLPPSWPARTRPPPVSPSLRTEMRLGPAVRRMQYGGLAGGPAAWRSGRIRQSADKSVALAGRRARLRSRSRLSYSALPIALAHRIAAWLRGRPDSAIRGWRGLLHVHRHYRRRGARIVGRPAADPAVLARLGIAGACCPHRASPNDRLGDAGQGRVIGVAGAPRVGHRHHRRGRPSCATRVPH